MSDRFLPYGRQRIDEDDIRAAVEVLRSDWLTTGPTIGRFEEAFADYVGAKHAVSVSSGTAALHAMLFAAGVGPGDEVIVPPITFAATSNAVLFTGGRPVFADVLEESLLLDPRRVEEAAGERTRAVLAVDYTGQPCDYDRLEKIASARGALLLCDACHSLGARYRSRKVGSIGAMTAFSFHPVKHITTAEGGMVTTDDEGLAKRLRSFRNHGIDLDHHDRAAAGSWEYKIAHLGYNYRLSDLQCALGLSQLKKLDGWLERRRALAKLYDEGLERLEYVRPFTVEDSDGHARHIYVVALDSGISRKTVFEKMRSAGIGVNVHYMPVYRHPLYVERFGDQTARFPVAEAMYERIITLPLFAGMSKGDVERVLNTLDQSISSAKGFSG